MIDFSAVLQASPLGVLATIDGEKIRTRMFQALFTEGNKVYFCTSNQKSVYQQLQLNSYATFCTHPQDFSPVLSIHGKAIFVDDNALKARILDENPGIKKNYESSDNPAFTVFYLEVEEVETFKMQEGRKSYSL